MNYKFNPKLGVIVCPHIFDTSRDVLLVIHDEGFWQCMCGMSDHGEEGHYVGIGHLIERDATIDQLFDLPEGWEAERSSIEDEWVRKKCD